MRALVSVLFVLLAFGLWSGLSTNHAGAASCGSPWQPDMSEAMPAGMSGSCVTVNAREGLFAYTTVPAAVLMLAVLAGAAAVNARHRGRARE